MLKGLSKDFYIIISVLLIFFVVFLFFIPFKRTFSNIFQRDSRVIKQYYSALDKKDYKSAYGFLADLTLSFNASKNKKLSFDIRPDLKKFKKDHEKIISAKVLKINRENKHCYPEVGLRCFKVEAKIKYKDMVVSPGGKTTIYIYTLNTGKKPLILGIRATP